MAGSAVIGNLAVNLTLETAAFQKGATYAQKQLAASQKRFEAIGAKMAGIGVGISASITAPFTALVSSAIPAAIESQKSIAQVEAALTSMGGASGRTAEQLQKSAEQLQSISTFDDDDILVKVTANLLTFGNVSGEVFDRAQLAAVNLSARLGQDLQSSAIQLGKALNDPIKGISALARVGVSFTAQQKDQIEALVASGRTMDAQKLILAELERQYGGAAKAQRDATPGADTTDAWRNFQETVGAIALRILPPLTNLLTKVLNAFNSLSPGMQTVVVAGTALLAALGPLLVALGGLVSVAAPLLAALGTGGLGAALAALGPLLIPIAAAAAAAYIAFKNWGTIGPVLAAFAKSLRDAIGPDVVALIETVKSTLSELWAGPLGEALRLAIAGLGQFYLAWNKALGSSLIAILKPTVAFLALVFAQIGDGLKFISRLLSGDWRGAWEAAAAIVNRSFFGLPEVIAGIMARLVEGVRTWLIDKLGVVWANVKAAVDKVKGYFFGLYDAVVGHSYVPDMVDEIGVQIARLKSIMVKPSLETIEEVKRIFREGTLTVQAETAKWFSQGSLVPEDISPAVSSIGDNLDDWDRKFNQIKEVLYEKLELPVRKTTAETVDAFRGMTENVLGSIDNLVRGIKHGGFLDILSGIADLFGALSGTGIFGKKLQAAFGGGVFSGGRALGGPVLPGRTYKVGENGPEYLHTGGMRGHITPANDMAPIVRIVPSPFFEAVVDDRAANVAAPMVAAGAAATAGAVTRSAVRAQSRRIG